MADWDDCNWDDGETPANPVGNAPSGSYNPPYASQSQSRTFTRNTYNKDPNRNQNSNPNWRARGNENEGQSYRNQSERSQSNRNQSNRGQYSGNQSNGDHSNRSQSYGNQSENNQTLSIPSSKVGKIIGKGGSMIKDIESRSGARVRIGEASSGETEITLSGSDTAVKEAEDIINDLIKEYVPRERTREPRENKNNRQNQREKSPVEEMPNFTIVAEDGYEMIDFERLNAYVAEKNKERWSKLPPIVKNFYKEDPKIAAMSPKDVAAWRKDNFDIQVKRAFGDKEGQEPIPNPVLTFEQAFRDYPEILEEIRKQGFEKPSPIQSQAWPVLLKGEDMIGIAQTGTGKTLAFLLPAFIHICGQPTPRDQRPGPTVLILAPTRELALQIDKEVAKYQYKGIKSVCLYGGGDRKEQISTVSKGVDIVIATPGRLKDLVKAQHVNVINFSYIVLDEADRMLDMGFESQIRVSLFDVRPNRQTVMTSATWPPGVQRLAEAYLIDPVQVNVGSLDLAAVHTVVQKIIFVEEEEKDQHLDEFIANMHPTDKVIVFCGRKATASDIFSNLCLKGINCQSIHGNLDQSDREAALEDITDGTVNILIATDVASRGIDIKDLTHVVNLDFPRHIEDYVHRVGRTGRAGRTGISISFVTRKDWAHARELMKILEEANQEIPDELEHMAKRFEAMQLRKDQEGGGNNHRGRGGGGHRGGRRDRW